MRISASLLLVVLGISAFLVGLIYLFGHGWFSVIGASPDPDIESYRGAKTKHEKKLAIGVTIVGGILFLTGVMLSLAL